jgi:hypothetical protein
MNMLRWALHACACFPEIASDEFVKGGFSASLRRHSGAPEANSGVQLHIGETRDDQFELGLVLRTIPE